VLSVVKTMKAFAVIALAAVAAVALAKVDINVEVGKTIELDGSLWDKITKTLAFNIKTETPYEKVQINAIRRYPFLYEGEAMYLCPGITPSAKCPNSTSPNVKFSGPLSPPGYVFTLYYEGEHLDIIPNVTIRVCDGACVDDCPSECGGRGGCLAGTSICVCDAGYHNKGIDCKSSGWDWLNWFILICCVVGVVLIALIVIIIILCVCCCKKGCCWCCRN